MFERKNERENRWIWSERKNEREKPAGFYLKGKTKEKLAEFSLRASVRGKTAGFREKYCSVVWNSYLTTLCFIEQQTHY